MQTDKDNYHDDNENSLVEGVETGDYTYNVEEVPDEELWQNLSIDIMGHIFEYYVFPLFRSSYRVLTPDYDPNKKTLHRSMIKLLYGYSKFDPSRSIILLFPTLDLSGFIYNYAAQEVPLTNNLVYQMVPFNGVRGLDLSKYEKLTGDVLIPLANSLKLKQLVLQGLRIYDESFVSNIGGCKNLETLDLSYTRISSKSMHKLFDGSFPYLRRLDLSFVEDEFSRQDMENLFSQHSLLYLSIFQNSYRPSTYRRIFSSKTLKELRFDHDKRLSNKTLIDCIRISQIPRLFFETQKPLDCHNQLAENPHLKELSLSAFDVEEEKIQVLWNSKSITCLTLLLERTAYTKNVAYKYLDGIEKNQTLQELYLLRCSQFDLSPLEFNTSITDLTLITAGINDDSLMTLCRNKKLKRINIFNNNIEGSCIDFLLNELPDLVHLNIGWNVLKPSFAIQIAQHPTLKTVQVRNTKIGNEGARALLQSSMITDLDISDNYLSDISFKDIKLGHNLTRLDARENRLGNIAAKTIFESTSPLVDVNLYSNNIGYLGVKSIEKNRTIRILDISANPLSTAAKLILLKHEPLLTVSFNTS